MITVGGGWDALTDGTFLGDSLTGPIGQATAATIVGAVGLAVGTAVTAAVEVVGGPRARSSRTAVSPSKATPDEGSGMAVVISDVVRTAAGSIWFGGVIGWR